MIDPDLRTMTKEEREYFDQYTLEPFACSVCKTQACKVIPLLPQLSEDDTPGLLVVCFNCEEQIGCIPITPVAYEMLLRAEMGAMEMEE